jgi:hypothetical protein
MMINRNEEYAAPSMMVVDVVCEAGFKNSSGDLTFSDGVMNGGWYDLY